jgi:hypothetical protein
MSQNSTPPVATHRAGLFDIRMIIAALLGMYGIILVLAGLFASDSQIAKSDHININLLGGICMIVAAAAFAIWARLRPIIVPDQPDTTDAGERPAGH